MVESPNGAAPATGQTVFVAIAWIYVGIPLAWGVTQTVLKSIALFR